MYNTKCIIVTQRLLTHKVIVSNWKDFHYKNVRVVYWNSSVGIVNILQTTTKEIHFHFRQRQKFIVYF
jgi:hypothetical protein